MQRGFSIWRGRPTDLERTCSHAGILPAALFSVAAAAPPGGGGPFDRPEPRHPTHVPLSGLQRSAVALLSLMGAFADPRRGDLVAAAGETTAGPALRAMRDRMRASESGQLLLAERPRVTPNNLNCEQNESVGHAWGLPPSTFGGAYAKFMGDRGFQADERPPVRFIGDPELAYVMARAREVHDFWHVLFGCHTNVFGEAAIKAVEWVQTGLPMTGLAVLAGEWKLRPAQRREFNRTFLPWAIRAGASAPDLICLYYERHFEEDLEGLRRKWRIVPAPPPPPPPAAARRARGAGSTKSAGRAAAPAAGEGSGR